MLPLQPLFPNTLRRAGALAVLLLVTACYAPAPASHAELRVLGGGRYTFNGIALDQVGLQARLAAEHAAHADLQVLVQATPEVDVQAVQAAIATLKSARVRIAFMHG